MSDASIILPSWRRPKDLVRSIENIFCTTEGLDVELVIVLNYDDEGSHEVVRDYDIKLVTMPRDMPSGRPMRCWQAGYLASTSDWVVQTADDVIFDDKWLEAGLNCPNKGIIGLWDPFRQGAFCTHFMATKDYISEVMYGYFGLTYYYCYWIDNEILYRANQVERYTICREASFTHLNRSILGLELDDYALISNAYYGIDQKTFYARLAAGFPKEWPEV